MIKLKKLLLEQSKRILRKGSHGDDVKELQRKLIKLKHLSPKLPNGDPADDGKFGSGTKKAVISFQKIAFPGQTEEWDGKVGTDTYAALDKVKTSRTTEPEDSDQEELPYTQYRNVHDTKKIIDLLYVATEGYGTYEKDLRYAIRLIKDKNTLDMINKLLQTGHAAVLAGKFKSSTEFIKLQNGSIVSVDWLDDYGSVKDIIDGEYGWWDAEDKQLSYNILNKIRGKGGKYGYDKDQDISLGPVDWFDKKISNQIRKILFKIAPNVAQYVMPKNMTTKDFNENEKDFLGQVINNAIKRSGKKTAGGVKYIDYSPNIQKLLEGGLSEPTSWFNLLGGIMRGEASATGGKQGFIMSTLLGQFTYKLQPDGTYKILPDIYDFSKGISIKNDVLIDELQGLTYEESIKYIMQHNTHMTGARGIYQAIRHIGHLENPEGGVRPDGSSLLSISVDGITTDTDTAIS